MCCERSKGPSAFLSLMTAAGFRVSSRTWHELRDMAGDAGFDTRKTRVPVEVSAASLRALVSRLGKERPDADVRALAGLVRAGIHEHRDSMSTISILRLLTENGVQASLLAVKAARKARRQGSALPVDAVAIRAAQRALFAAEDQARARRASLGRLLERRIASRAPYQGELQGQESLY